VCHPPHLPNISQVGQAHGGLPQVRRERSSNKWRGVEEWFPTQHRRGHPFLHRSSNTCIGFSKTVYIYISNIMLTKNLLFMCNVYQGTKAVRRTTARRTCQHQRIPQPPTHRQLQENGLHPGSMYSVSRSHTHRHSLRIWHSSERHPIDGRGRR